MVGHRAVALAIFRRHHFGVQHTGQLQRLRVSQVGPGLGLAYGVRDHRDHHRRRNSRIFRAKTRKLAGNVSTDAEMASKGRKRGKEKAAKHRRGNE